MQQKMLQLSKHFFATIIAITLLSACSTGSSRLIEAEKLNFSYSDDAYLFFRNMRQTKYVYQNMEEKQLRLYTHKDYQKTSLSTSLVVNWRANKAFAILNVPEELDKQSIKFFWNDNGQYRPIEAPNFRRQGELQLLTNLYNHLLQEHELLISIKKGEKTPLFTDVDEQEAFRISMYDFYRLTNVL